MKRSISATYRRDIETLAPVVSTSDRAKLIRLAERIQEARQRPHAGSHELDAAIEAYMQFRDSALSRSAE